MSRGNTCRSGTDSRRSARLARYVLASLFPKVFMVPPIMMESQAEEGGSQADQQRNKQDDQVISRLDAPHSVLVLGLMDSGPKAGAPSRSP